MLFNGWRPAGHDGVEMGENEGILRKWTAFNNGEGGGEPSTIPSKTESLLVKNEKDVKVDESSKEEEGGLPGLARVGAQRKSRFGSRKRSHGQSGLAQDEGQERVGSSGGFSARGQSFEVKTKRSTAAKNAGESCSNPGGSGSAATILGLDPSHRRAKRVVC